MIFEHGTKNGEEALVPQHIFCHDREYAYDSLGKHPLPYRRDTSEDGAENTTEYNVPEYQVEGTNFVNGDLDEAWQHIAKTHPQYKAQAMLLEAGVTARCRRFHSPLHKQTAPTQLAKHWGKHKNTPDNHNPKTNWSQHFC